MNSIKDVCVVCKKTCNRRNYMGNYLMCYICRSKPKVIEEPLPTLTNEEIKIIEDGIANFMDKIKDDIND